MFKAVKQFFLRLFGKSEEQAPVQPRSGRKLTKAERKEIEAVIAASKRNDRKELSAQDSIPYQRMFPDGICRVTDTYYTKTVQFQDINYQLSQNEDKTAIFDGWCDYLNYFDSSIRFQLSFINLAAGGGDFGTSITIQPRKDSFNSVRQEYSTMLENQLAKGNNGLSKTKYLTFGIEAENIKAAKPRLERIETDILNNFKRLGVSAEVLNGAERLRLMHGIFHMDSPERFKFSWDWLAPSGLSTKDFIAPSSFEFKNGRMFRMGRKFGAMSFVQIMAPELNDRMLADFLDMESSLIVNLHIQSVDQVNAIKTVKRKITDLDSAKIEQQKKAVRAGYDMDLIPSDLATYGTEAKKLLQDLQSRNERMFLVTMLVLNTADTQRQLDNNVFQASSIAQKHNCQLVRLDFQQEQGLMSSLPLGYNQIEIQRSLTTSSTAIFVPFTTCELFQRRPEALYYGLNALSNNLIMVDRKALKNPNGLILGTPGSGKSFSAKREILNVFLVTDDDIIICDPEAEYYPLVRRLDGQVIKIAPTSKQYVNPMDLKGQFVEIDGHIWKMEAATAGDGAANGNGIKFTQVDFGDENINPDYAVTFTSAETNATTASELKFVGTVNRQVQNTVKGVAVGSTHQAQVTTAIDFTKLKDGDTFTVGDKTYIFAVGKDSKYVATPGTISGVANNPIDLTGIFKEESDLLDAQKQADAMVKITETMAAGANTDTWTVGNQGVAGNIGTLTFQSQSTYNGENTTVTTDDKYIGGITANGVCDMRTEASVMKQFYSGRQESGAKLSFDIDVTKIKAGQTFTIDGKTFEFVDGAGNGKEGNVEIDLSNEGIAAGILSSQTATVMEKIKDVLGANGANNGALLQSDGATAKYKVTYDGNRMTLSTEDDINTPAFENRVAGKMSLPTVSTTGKGLSLQIGDTSDSFNQLKVNIKDCHTTGMGIDKISIADQSSAQSAVSVIKDAINYVSDVRGTLGATQNRLDHTINNLAVMTENIQDAESTIRDVDVAEEMMAYTKNNILIQSAQAMLAQANQMPQGVLQLLQ